MTTDTTERGLERLICTALTGSACDAGPARGSHASEGAGTHGAGWICGSPGDYDREYCVDLVQLSVFLRETQPDAADALSLDEDGPTRRRFLARLQGEITRRGTIDVLRHGIKHGPLDLDLFYGTRRRATGGRGSCMPPIASASAANCATAATRRSSRSTSRCSSTACRSPPSS